MKHNKIYEIVNITPLKVVRISIAYFMSEADNY